MSWYGRNDRRTVGFRQPNTQPVRRKTYKNWDWGNYGNYGLKEEKDELFVANNEGYFTPTTYDIESRLPWGTQLKTRENVQLIKEMSRFFFHKMIDEKDYIDPEFQSGTLSEEQQAVKDQKIPFYEELWDKFIPGFSPLEKALSLFNQMVENHKQKGGDDKSFGEKFDENQRAAIEEVHFDDSVFEDPEYNQLLDMEFFKQKKFNKVSILNKISLIKNLGSEFKIEKDITDKIVQNSNLIAKKMMRDYSQVFNVDLYQRLFPDFDMKLLTKNLTINVPIERTEHKQKIIMILDFSGSMSNQEKQEWVLAILVDRLKYAMLEEAEVFFSYFVHDPSAMNFFHIKDRKSAMAFWQQFSTNPNGGGTDVNAMIERIKHEIEEKHQLMNLNVDLSEDKPEVLVINDGDDSINTKSFTYKTNAISIYRHNNELEKLCVGNKGKYVHVGREDGADIATTYSQEGKQKLTV